MILRSFFSMVVCISFIGSAANATERLSHYDNAEEIACVVRLVRKNNPEIIYRILGMADRPLDENDICAEGRELKLFDLVLVPRTRSKDYSFGYVFGSKANKIWVVFWKGDKFMTKCLHKKQIYIPAEATQSSSHAAR